MKFMEQVQVNFWCWFYRKVRRPKKSSPVTADIITNLLQTRHPMWDTEYTVSPTELLSGCLGFEDVNPELLPLLRMKNALINEAEMFL